MQGMSVVIFFSGHRVKANVSDRLDAVQDILDHPTFEATFTEIAKGIPDLERIVSRIHAKSCRVKDFLKVLKVSTVCIELGRKLSQAGVHMEGI